MARKQPETLIGDLPTRTIPAVAEHLSMAAARKVAALKQVALLLVERDGRLVGVLDERVLGEAADDAGVAASMTPVGPCLHPAMPVGRARDLFILSQVSIMPVTVGAFLIGAVSRGDIELALAKARDATPSPIVRAHAAA
jgi:CBS domain-containing protein